MVCACAILKGSKIIYDIILENFQIMMKQEHVLLGPKPNKIMQDHHTIDDHFINNTPFVQNNSFRIQTMDLQWIFKNKEHGGRITHLYTTEI